MKAHTHMEHGRKDGRSQRGSALLVVLLLLGVISVLVAVVARSVSGAAIEIGEAKQAARREADLRAGIELGAVTILRLGPTMRSAEAFVTLPDRRIEVRVTNERARIDLNAASPVVLSSLLKAKGVAEGEAAALAKSVIEWRGGSASQKLAAPGGDDQRWSSFTMADGSQLRSDGESRAPSAQTIGTRFFLHPMQLASLPGFSRALVARLMPHITVGNGSNQLDPNIATRDVLLALPGASPAAVDALLGDRESGSGRQATPRELGIAEGLVTSKTAAGWRVEISSVGPAARIYRAEAVIAVLDGDSEPYRVLYVLDAL